MKYKNKKKLEFQTGSYKNELLLKMMLCCCCCCGCGTAELLGGEGVVQQVRKKHDSFVFA